MAKNKKTVHKTMRFTPEVAAQIDKLAKQNKMSFSEFVRHSIEGNLTAISEKKDTGLTAEERGFALRNLATMAENLGHMKRDSTKHGNNLNQIAKKLNSGGAATKDDMRLIIAAYKRTGALNDISIKMSKVVNKIWQSLV